MLIATNRFLLLLLSAVALFGAALCRSAQAQGDDLVVEDPVPAAVQPRAVIADSNFDRWMFGNDRNANLFRSRVENLLNSHIAEVASLGSLTDGQKRKLQLAGRVDIQRFFDETEVLRKEFQIVKLDQNRLAEFSRRVQSKRMMAESNLFNESSLFGKTVQKTLTAEQRAQFEQFEEQRRRFQFRARVELAVGVLDRGMGLRDSQRQQILEFLMESAIPPRVYGQYDYYVILLQMSRIPQDKLKPLFDDAQWHLLQKQFDQYRGLEPTLVQMGVVFEPAVKPNPPAEVRANK